MMRVERRQNIEPDLAAVNESLMLALVRQHELTEEAVTLNAQLAAEVEARSKAEEALINAEKLASVGRMAAVLAHKINNPLEAVTNVLFLVQTSEHLPEEARHYLEIADSELKRIAHITRQTLGFYRESSSPLTFSVRSLIDSVVDLLKARRMARQAEILQQCPETLMLTAFQGELRQVLSNLVANSLDAIDVGGRVTIRAAPSIDAYSGTQRVRITVSDNGVGMSRAVLSKVFAPFFTTKGSVGNGLGLWVSSQIIEKHSGCIKVRSATQGAHRGTTFSLVLPATLA